jgi:hypothetical protein
MSSLLRGERSGPGSGRVLYPLFAAALLGPIRLDYKSPGGFEPSDRGKSQSPLLAKGKDMGIIAFIILGLLAGAIAK